MGSRMLRTPIVYRSVQIPGAEVLFHQRRAAYERTRHGYEEGVRPDTSSA